MSAKRERGFLAESRFIYLANVPPDPRCRPPRGYVRLEQAPPIMDVRGIDGFVVHYRLSTTTAPRRIPIQLKNGGEPWVASASTHCGMEIPILHTSTDITQFNVLDRIRQLLDYHERYKRVYDEVRLQTIERNTPTSGELEVVDLIERSRAAFSYRPPGQPPAQSVEQIAAFASL